MVTAREIFDTAKQLPEGDRAALAAWLIDSLDPVTDGDAQLHWDAEIQRRLQQLDSGEVTPVPWSEARKMILGTLDGSPAS